ncbi:MAG: acetoin utilization protein AcuC [Ardenticatenaceae bacterium]
MTRAAFIGDDSLWQRGHPPGHPLRPERLRNTWEMLQAYGALDHPNTHVAPPRRAAEEELAVFHTWEYINAVRKLSQGDRSVNAARYGFGPGDNPVFEGMFETEALKVGAALVGVELLLAGKADVAFSFSGGLHHASPDYASGFCIFGDAAVAIHHLLAARQRVAYVDIDAHHGDGVQAAFYDDPRVLTISFHESGHFLFPGTGFTGETGTGSGEGYSANVPLFPATDDETFLWAFDEIVPPLVTRFSPDLVVAQLGVDAHWRDPLTHLALTTHGFEALFQRIHGLSPRWLALGGGGYAQDVVPRAWTIAWGIMSEQSLLDTLPAPIASHYNPPHLHDALPAPLTPQQREQARAAAETTVREVKRLLKL